jgi:hypothetical protein
LSAAGSFVILPCRVIHGSIQCARSRGSRNCWGGRSSSITRPRKSSRGSKGIGYWELRLGQHHKLRITSRL